MRLLLDTRSNAGGGSAVLIMGRMHGLRFSMVSTGFLDIYPEQSDEPPLNWSL